MTDDQDRPDQGYEESTAEVDSLLGAFLLIAEDGIGFGLTLHVPGGVVTGRVVGGSEWLAALRQTIREGGAPELADHLAGTEQRTREAEQDRRQTNDLPHYVHLRDAQWFAGNQLAPTEQGVLWRGRLSEVSGWCLGNSRIPAPE